MIGEVLLWIGIVLAGLALLLLFLIFPALRRHKGRAMFEGKCIAHRGLHGTDNGIVPENSLAAFRRAAEKGYPIETDIHLTKDGRVAVFHDDDLKRMCGDARKPEELTLAELKELRLAGTEESAPILRRAARCARLRRGSWTATAAATRSSPSFRLCSAGTANTVPA